MGLFVPCFEVTVEITFPAPFQPFAVHIPPFATIIGLRIHFAVGSSFVVKSFPVCHVYVCFVGLCSEVNEKFGIVQMF